MFYEVRVLDRKGKVKKVLSSKSLSNRYWNSFFEGPGAAEALKKPKGKQESEANDKSKVGYKNLYFSED
ncbi:MAG TPA: hypothetical protein QGI40_05755 [Nitrospinaceae bacterium]|jgi:hypothetical protein|nr:hypothetical protein [Nitrospinaceae bacterium]HJL73349.1 hypothetical protein [Nitrospinaceae bacterium]|tara:strand:- start:95 stop:301 length:207 start_codon:yes stop_codon:yes gene_type:complete